MTGPRALDLSIEPARSSDLDAVIEIDARTLGSKSAAQVYTSELANELSRLDVVVATATGGQREVVAFINYWLVADEVHLLSVATRPDMQRCGIARQMMRHLVSFARDNGARCITLEVRASNRAAAALYQSLGFETVSIRRRYYADEDEDALVMLLGMTAPL